MTPTLPKVLGCTLIAFAGCAHAADQYPFFPQPTYFKKYFRRVITKVELEGPAQLDDHVVDSRHRHQLFLAFKEALTNVVRHSGASEVRLSIRVEDGHVHLAIADNGRGLARSGQTEEMDGVANMRTRLQKLGGRFEVKSKAGEGTVLSFDLPLH